MLKINFLTEYFWEKGAKEVDKGWTDRERAKAVECKNSPGDI
jgi:hypothetical protein